MVLGSMTLINAVPVDYGEEYKNVPNSTYTQTFSDVPMNHWAFEYIAEMVSKGVISGYPDGMFRPDRQVTRGEFAKLISVASGLPVKTTGVSSFYDVNTDDWYSPYIEAAKDLLTGYNIAGKAIYNPETVVIREDIAIAMVKMKGYDVSIADLSIIQAMFTDYEGISAYGRKYVAVAVERGLISGYTDQTFRAQNSITRAEVATMLWRASQYGNDNKIDASNTDNLVTEKVEIAVPESNTGVQENNEDKSTDETEKVEEEETEEIKPYTIDTIAEVDDYADSMVVDKDNVLHYVVDDMVYNSNGKKLDTSSLKYNIGYDDKNYDYSLSLIHLAYDEYNNILYIIANDSEDKLIVYDITDYSNPEPILNRHNCEKIEEASVKIDYAFGLNIKSRIEVLKNSALVMTNIESDVYNGYDKYEYNSNIRNMLMINPKTGALSKYEKVYDVAKSIEGTLADLDLDSVKMYHKNKNIYFWIDGEGYVKIDKDGYRHIIATPDDIEDIDYKGLSGFNIWNCTVDNDESFIFYDNSDMCIRIIKKR